MGVPTPSAAGRERPTYSSRCGAFAYLIASQRTRRAILPRPYAEKKQLHFALPPRTELFYFLSLKPETEALGETFRRNTPFSAYSVSSQRRSDHHLIVSQEKQRIKGKKFRGSAEAFVYFLFLNKFEENFGDLLRLLFK